MGSTWTMLTKRIPRTAGVLLLMLSVLAAVVLPSASLKARQDEPEGNAGAVQSLPRPKDMNAENLDQHSTDLQAKISTIWDTAKTVETRQQAISDVRPLLESLTGDAAKDALRIRLQRRVSLVEAALKAAAVTDLQTATTDYRGQVRSAADAVGRTLNALPNGALWTEYLRLSTLTAPDLTTESLKGLMERTSL